MFFGTYLWFLSLSFVNNLIVDSFHHPLSTALEAVLRVMSEEARDQVMIAIEAQKNAAAVSKIHSQTLRKAMDIGEEVGREEELVGRGGGVCSIGKEVDWRGDIVLGGGEVGRGGE